MMHYGSMHYGWMGFGWVFQLLILVLFFAVVWWMLRSQNTRYSADESAEDILKKRLATGEITRKEFHELKKELEG